MADENRVYTSATVEEAIQQMEVQAVNFAYRFIMDARVRSEYMRSTKEMAEQSQLRAVQRRSNVLAIFPSLRKQQAPHTRTVAVAF